MTEVTRAETLEAEAEAEAAELVVCELSSCCHSATDVMNSIAEIQHVTFNSKESGTHCCSIVSKLCHF